MGSISSLSAIENLDRLQRHLHELAEQHASALLGLVALTTVATITFASHKRGPPAFWDPIPFIYNSIQYLLFNEVFMVRVNKVLSRTDLAIYNFFATPVYLVGGSKNIQTVFTSGWRVGNEHLFANWFFPNLYGLPKADTTRFSADRSGRGRVPAPGHENLPPEERYWYGYERIYTDLLGRSSGHLKPISEYFSWRYAQSLEEQYGLGEWATISVMELCKRVVSEINTEAMVGPTCLELNPGLMDAFWDLDTQTFNLALGLPKWLHPTPYQKQERFFAMMRRWISHAWENFDWDGPAADSAWEPYFGARICREVVKWSKDRGFTDQLAVGSMAMFVFGMNSNSNPTTMWVIMEIVRDQDLLQAVREEVATVFVENPETGSRTLDIEGLVRLPLLQSVLAEVLRLHMNFNVLRYVNDPITIDGHKLRRGVMVAAPMLTAHHDETGWGATGHPASEFWAERHIRHKEVKDGAGNISKARVFTLAGRPSSYFPFGGGQYICPGRYLAKYQILTTVALLVTKFELGTISWTKPDGSPSDRPAKGDGRFSGSGMMPPDRDLVVRAMRVS